MAGNHSPKELWSVRTSLGSVLYRSSRCLSGCAVITTLPTLAANESLTAVIGAVFALAQYGQDHDSSNSFLRAGFPYYT